MTRSVRRTAAITVLLAWLAAGARAEIVILQNGTALEGRPVRVGRLLRIELSPRATVIVPMDEVREIRPGTWRDEYARRRRAIKEAGPESRYKLAVWCLGKNLLEEYQAELLAVLEAAPEHEAARSRLENLAAAARRRAQEEERSAPPSDPDREPENRLPGRVSIQGDGADGCAQAAAAEAERAIATLSDLLDVPGDHSRLTGLRIALRYYSRPRDYLEAAREAGVSGNAGHYDPATRICHVLGRPDGELDSTRLGNIRHEVTHAYLWEVLDVSANDPWLHEALCTLMEGEGQQRIARKRLQVLAAHPMYLDITVRGLFDSRFQTGTLGERLLDYSRAWSFAHYMLTGGDAARRRKFLAFLADCSGPWVDLRAALLKHFPDGEEMEAGWRRHVAGLLASHRGPKLPEHPALSLEEDYQNRHAPARRRPEPNRSPAPVPAPVGDPGGNGLR